MLSYSKMATSCNESCAPKKKHPRLGVRFQMELNFSSNDEKDNFLTRLEQVKHYFSSRSSQSLDLSTFISINLQVLVL